MPRSAVGKLARYVCLVGSGQAQLWQRRLICVFGSLVVKPRDHHRPSFLGVDVSLDLSDGVLGMKQERYRIRDIITIAIWPVLGLHRLPIV